jgi:chorismate mutase
VLRHNEPVASDDATSPNDAPAGPGVRRLHELRGTIDNLDAAIVHLLAERFKCTQEVGRIKATYDMPPADPAREAEQVERLRGLARAASLDPAFAEKFLNFIIEEVIRHHRTLAEQHAGSADPAAGAAGSTRAAGPDGS